jgi:hypothetical protein
LEICQFLALLSPERFAAAVVEMNDARPVPHLQASGFVVDSESPIFASIQG